MYVSIQSGIHGSTVLWCSKSKYKSASRPASFAENSKSVCHSRASRSTKLPRSVLSVDQSTRVATFAGRIARSLPSAFSGLARVFLTRTSWGFVGT